MAWISRNSSLTQAEMENNADIIIEYYRQNNLADETIAGILGNMQAESTINPERQEVGGQGYGLVQWTPVSVLQNHCTTLGLSPYNDGDVQIEVILSEVLNVSGVAEWYTTLPFISNYYNSGATPDMVGITGNEFLTNSMGWSADKLAIMFMAGYERPSYDPTVNHYDIRMEFANNWFLYMGGQPIPSSILKKRKFPWAIFTNIIRKNRRAF